MNTVLTTTDIRTAIGQIGGYRNLMIPEFTWSANRKSGDVRIDALLVETHKRWIRGFEIKLDRSDWLADDKWHLYTEFTSSLSIACPAGLIKRDEVQKPYGLLWVSKTEYGVTHKWERMPKRFQQRDGLAWMWTYLRVIESELPRLNGELDRVRQELEWAKRNAVRG